MSRITTPISSPTRITTPTNSQSQSSPPSDSDIPTTPSPTIEEEVEAEGDLEKQI